MSEIDDKRDEILIAANVVSPNDVDSGREFRMKSKIYRCIEIDLGD